MKRKIIIFICVAVIIIASGIGIAQAVFPTGGIPIGVLRDLLNRPRLDHFEIASVSPPQAAGAAFNITIKAKDQNNQDLTSWNGTVVASQLANNFSSNDLNLYFPDTDIDVTPNFTNGSWSGPIVLTTAVKDSWLKVVSGDGKTGESNHFDVNAGAIMKLNLTCAPTLLLPGQASICTASGFGDSYGNVVSDPTILAQTKWSFQAGANCSNGNLLVDSNNPNKMTFTAGTPKTTCLTTIVATNGNATNSFGITVKVTPPLFPIKVEYNGQMLQNPPPGFSSSSSGTVSEKAP